MALEWKTATQPPWWGSGAATTSYLVGRRQSHTQNLFTLVKKICERLKSICGYNSTGGDLVFFIEGLQKAVKEVKKTVGEEVDDEELEGAGAAV